MNIYDLARELLRMYFESEEALLVDSFMGSGKFERKIKALDAEVAEYESRITAMEESARSRDEAERSQ